MTESKHWIDLVQASEKRCIAEFSLNMMGATDSAYQCSLGDTDCETPIDACQNNYRSMRFQDSA